MTGKQNVVTNRLHISTDSDGAAITINGKLEPWKTVVLVLWLAAWLCVGAAVIMEFVRITEREMKLLLVVFLVFWAYYLWKVGQVCIYRIQGYEEIRIAQGEVLVTRNILGSGKPKRYFIDNIAGLKHIVIPEKSWAASYENLWWVLGGERVGFNYQDKFVRFGMQLSEQETQELIRFLKKYMTAKRRGKQR
jgi:hypothetical protein